MHADSNPDSKLIVFTLLHIIILPIRKILPWWSQTDKNDLVLSMWTSEKDTLYVRVITADTSKFCLYEWNNVVDVVTKWINVSTDDNSDWRDYREWLLYPSPWATITPQESGDWSTPLSPGNTYSFSFDWSLCIRDCKLPGISLLRFFWRIRDGEMAQMAFKYYILFLIMC